MIKVNKKSIYIVFIVLHITSLAYHFFAFLDVVVEKTTAFFVKATVIMQTF